METLTLKSPFDMHLHLRDGEILENVIQYTAQNFALALAMPNLESPIVNVELAMAYKQRILESCKRQGIEDFMPLMSLYLTPSLNKAELIRAKEQGIFILKLYPKGSTTGSESGVKEILDSKILEILGIAEDLGMVVSIHGESNGFVMEREVEFHPVFEVLAKSFPKLRIIFEHLSDHRSIALVEKYENLFATLTLHHMLLSLDNVVGGMLNPHYFCKPILKTKKDQEALLQVALSGHSKFSFGSDSAPHLRSAKEQKGAAGIFSAPILLPLLAQIFESNKALERLETFISYNASNIYQLPFSQKNVKLCKKPMIIPQECYGIVPMLAGETLEWSVA
ncbi:MAG: dihydroorotase [Helicobacter sp.]|nr:dihydroorotase [Helicobacter sp.]